MQEFILRTLENSTNIGWYFMLVGGGGLVVYFLYNYLQGEDPLTGDITNLEHTGKRLEFFKVCFIALVTPALITSIVALTIIALVGKLIGFPAVTFIDGLIGADDEDDLEDDDLWDI